MLIQSFFSILFLASALMIVENASPLLAADQYAVVIGISQYQDQGINQLKYASLDALSVHDFLTDPKGGGYSENNVKLLLDEQATRANIMSALGTFLAQNAQEDDTVFIFYSGHGATEIDKSGQSQDGRLKFIVPHDADSNSLFSTAISTGQLDDTFNRIESKHLIYVADACYSGSSTGGRGFKKDTGTKDLPLSDEFLDKMSKGGNRLIMTASEANELALESDEFSNGIFTHYFLEGLKGAADADGNNKVTDEEVYEYLRKKVSAKASKDKKGKQHPVRKSSMATTVSLASTGNRTKDYWDKKSTVTKHTFFKKEIHSWFEEYEEAIEEEDLERLKKLGHLTDKNMERIHQLRETFAHTSERKLSIEIEEIQIDGTHARVRYDHSQKWTDENGSSRKAPSRSSERKFKRIQGKWIPVK